MEARGKIMFLFWIGNKKQGFFFFFSINRKTTSSICLNRQEHKATIILCCGNKITNRPKTVKKRCGLWRATFMKFNTAFREFQFQTLHVGFLLLFS